MITFLLDLLAFGAIFSGLLVITSQNPVISVLFLISVFLNAAGYLLLLGVGFIGISYLIVYVGAIAILFLFVIIMLNIQLTEIVSTGQEYTQNLPLGFLIGSIFFFEVFSVLPFQSLNGLFLGTDSYMAMTYPSPESQFSPFLQIEIIGQTLYTTGSLWLILGSLILLLAMLGPVLLCMRQSSP